MLPTNIYPFVVQANGLYRLTVAGRYFKIMSSTGEVEVTADFGRLSPMKTGRGLEDTPFSYLNFRDLSGAGNELVVVVGDKNFVDGISGTSEISKNVVPQSPNFSTTGKAVATASAQLVAGNLARQYLLIQNNHPSSTLFLGFGAGPATLADGLKVVPGGFAEFASCVPTGAIHAIADAANAAVVVVEG